MYCVYETVCNVPGGWVVWEDYSLLTVATSSPEWTQDWAQFVAARPPVETFIIPSTWTFNDYGDMDFLLGLKTQNKTFIWASVMTWWCKLFTTLGLYSVTLWLYAGTVLFCVLKQAVAVIMMATENKLW